MVHSDRSIPHDETLLELLELLKLLDYWRPHLVGVDDHGDQHDVGGALGDLKRQGVLEQHEEGDAEAPEVAGLAELPSLQQGNQLIYLPSLRQLPSLSPPKAVEPNR